MSLERHHFSDNAHEVVEWSENLVNHVVVSRSVMDCVVGRVAHGDSAGHHNRGANLVQSSVVRSSVHLVRVDYRAGRVVDHGSSMVDHGSGVVDHWC